uniref:DEK-C domain-containing protein n=1 Tax=Chenopodium quinoa TaxID=63459 RepID=A0A803LWL2_CHEQI
MDAATKEKVQETVLEILRTADMQKMTEYNVRTLAGENLGIDLSESSSKKFLSEKRRVTIQDFKGKTLVSIREYYKKDGKFLPTSKGISLTAEQWSSFYKNVPAIEKAIEKMEESWCLVTGALKLLASSRARRRKNPTIKPQP